MALLVPAWIGAAYFFTSSTSFANPAVTVARTLTDTFAGIAPVIAPAFIAAELAGAAVGAGLAVLLWAKPRPHRVLGARNRRPPGVHAVWPPRQNRITMTDKPAVLFVCVHNAGRSQIAAGYLAALSAGAVVVRSAGSEPADQINPMAIEAMAEVGIDIAHETPKILKDTDVADGEVVITMGCGDRCPFYPGRRYEDWDVTDPAGRPIEDVRQIRDDIRGRVLGLLDELGITPNALRP